MSRANSWVKSTWDTAWAEGRAMSMNEAIDFALG